MTNRLAKIIQFGAKRRHVRGRVTTNGELIRTLVLLRHRRDDDDGPRAAKEPSAEAALIRWGGGATPPPQRDSMRQACLSHSTGGARRCVD